MTLCTEEQAEALLPAGADIPTATFTALEEMASDMIDNALGRPAEGGTEITETHRLPPGIPRNELILDRFPVSAVGSVVEDGTTLAEGTDYLEDLDAGILTRILDADGIERSWETGKIIAVTYTPATVPIARTICAKAIARAYRQTDQATAGVKPAVMAGLRQLTIGRWSATAETTAQTIAEGLHLTDSELAELRAVRDRRP